MTILPIDNPASAIADHSAARLVGYASKTLLNPHIPMRLKATSYLRLICAALQKTQAPTAREHQAPKHLQQLYLQHLTALLTCDQQWWQHCHISSDGILWSHNVALDQVLQPLGTFAKQYCVSTRPYGAIATQPLTPFNPAPNTYSLMGS